jgi:hypothetical protein
LAYLEFSHVGDFVHLQEIGHRYLIALGDGSQSFAFGDDMDGTGGKGFWGFGGIGGEGGGGGGFGGSSGWGFGRAGCEAGGGGGFGFEQEVEAGDFLGEDVDLFGLLLEHLAKDFEFVAGGSV